MCGERGAALLESQDGERAGPVPGKQEKGKAAVQKIWHADSLGEAEKWKKEFRKTFGGQYPKAVEILEKDWQALTALLRISEGALETSEDDEHYRVAIRRGSTKNVGGKAIQAC